MFRNCFFLSSFFSVDVILLQRKNSGSLQRTNYNMLPVKALVIIWKMEERAQRLINYYFDMDKCKSKSNAQQIKIFR